MPSSYSQDFRKKVMVQVKKGKSCNEASLKFDIASNTVRNWYKRYKKEGHYEARIRLGKSSRIDREEFENYVDTNPNLILSQVGEKYGISIRTASYYMKKFGYSYKKNVYLCGSKTNSKRIIYKKYHRNSKRKSSLYGCKRYRADYL